MESLLDEGQQPFKILHKNPGMSMENTDPWYTQSEFAVATDSDRVC